VRGGPVNQKAICGHTGSNISGKAKSFKKAGVTRSHGEDKARIGVDCIAILGLGKPIGEVEFGEHIRAVEEPVVSPKEKWYAGFKQLPYRRKRQTKGSIGTRIKNGDRVALREQINFLVIGHGEMNDKVRLEDIKCALKVPATGDSP